MSGVFFNLLFTVTITSFQN